MTKAKKVHKIRKFSIRGELSVSSCETPLGDEQLRWHQGIHLAGPMSEAQLGPTTRNNAGGEKSAMDNRSGSKA
ncbi:MAG: hypothetical protein JJU16_05660 [Alkalibacterium sp.]|nr:hypothetical protein [Alkalibacterium sp.]